MRSILYSRIGAGFPAPKVDHFRLMRMVTETVIAITAATVMMMLIIVASFPLGRDFPGL